MALLAAFFTGSATSRSWFGAPLARGGGRFLGLARLSLGVAGISMLPACLVDDPPPLSTPQKTAPRLDYGRATPGLDQVIVKNSGEFIEFSIPVKSEDAGDPLVGNLLLDYAGEGSALVPIGFPPTVAASTLDDPNERRLKTIWEVYPKTNISAGCHRFTLRVTHFSNLDPDHSGQLIDKEDLAEAFWFANINVTPESAGMLVNCPLGSSGNR
jgi:hypothetical protein